MESSIDLREIDVVTVEMDIISFAHVLFIDDNIVSGNNYFRRTFATDFPQHIDDLIHRIHLHQVTCDTK